MTGALPVLQQDCLERVRAEVEADPRLLALLAAGSYIHGGFDEHSDLDFIVLVEPDRYDEVMATRTEFAGKLAGLLSAFTGEHVGEPRLLICLYGPPLLHVDFKFITPDDLVRLVERPAVLFARDARDVEGRLDAAHIAWPDASPDWFEQRAWIWLHYGATKLARGELYEAIGMLAYFREQVLGPMLHRRERRPQRGVRRIEAAAGPELARLASTVAAVDAPSVRAALLAAADLYLDLRNDNPPQRTTAQMPAALRDFLNRAA